MYLQMHSTILCGCTSSFVCVVVGLLVAVAVEHIADGVTADERKQSGRHRQRAAHADEQLAPAEVTTDACRRPRVQIHLVCFGALREETETNKGLKARRRIR